MEKQRRLILQATDDERVARCMRLVGADLGATRRVDFDAASELRTDGDGRYAVVSTASGRTVGEGLSESRAEALANEHGPAFEARPEGQR